MAASVPSFSALHCTRAAPPPVRAALANWSVESAAPRPPPRPTHPHFDEALGVYTVPKDGLYLLQVQLIPIGGATLYTARRNRSEVHYALRLQEDVASDDDIESTYIDVGGINLGQVEHLRAHTRISCVRMPAATGNECVRMSIECIQRKRKREEREVSKKELKRRKKKRRAAGGRAAHVESSDQEDDSESDSEWEHGFDSDSTSDELPYSTRGVGRLAKRVKTSASVEGAASAGPSGLDQH